MKLTVIGAGAIGSAVVQDLDSRPEVTQIQVCDARARSLQDLHDTVQSSKLRSFQVDVRDPNVLEPILQGSDCVVGAAAPDLNPMLARICISVGSNFCDLGGNDAIVAEELALDQDAREKGVWVIPNCGLAPGLVNILCMHGVEQFDEVESAHLRVGDVPLHPEAPFNFRISWSAEKVIDDYSNPVQLIRDGEVIEEEPLSRLETIHFPQPFDGMEAFCTAGGLSTLAQDLAGRVGKLDHKTIRWPGHASQMAFLLGLGLGEDRSIDVLTHLTYRDVLVRRLRQRLGGKYEDAVLLRVLLWGSVGGETKTLVYEMIDTYDAALKMTAMRRCASIPTATIATLVASGALREGGAAPPERIIPHDAFIEAVIERGLRITRTWYDGHMDVRDTLTATTPVNGA